MMFRWLIVLWACFGLAQAGTSVLPERQLLGKAQVQSLDDASGRLQIAQILAAAADSRPLAAPAPGLQPHWHWLRIPLLNPSAQAVERILALGVPDVEHLEVYRVRQGVAERRWVVPSDAPFSARPLPHSGLALPLTLAAGEQSDVLLRYQIHGDTPLRLELFSVEGYQQHLEFKHLANGLVIGVLAALLLFALLQYLARRSPANLYYAAMVSLILMFVMQIEGYNFHYLWPTQGQWNQHAPLVIIVGVHLTHIAFTISLFDLRSRLPKLFYAYLVAIAGLVIAIVFFLITSVVLPIIVISLLYMPLPVVVGVLAWRQRLPASGIFLLGASCMIIFVNVLFGLGVAGVEWLSAVSVFVYPKLGYLCEAALFGTALASKVRVLHQRHEANLRHRLAEAEQLVQAEAEKNQALQAAQQQQLQLAAAGHDLSQPLASIRFAMSALRAQSATDANTTEHIDKALDYTESLLRGLIRDAKQGMAQHAQILSLEEVLAEAHARHSAAANRKGLRLRFHPTMLEINASRLVLGRILDNLVGNAIRYTDRGHIVLGVRRRRGAVEIQVIDTGHGLDTSQLSRLLAPFQQSGQLAAEQLGHGLGLHIVQALCEQSGYRLTIRSVRGRGSVFGVWIPVS